MKESTGDSSASPVHLQFESFVSPITNNHSRTQSAAMSNNEQLIIYAAPVIQMQLSSRCKETIDRLKEIKKEKGVVLAIINPQTSRHRDGQQQ